MFRKRVWDWSVCWVELSRLGRMKVAIEGLEITTLLVRGEDGSSWEGWEILGGIMKLGYTESYVLARSLNYGFLD